MAQKCQQSHAYCIGHRHDNKIHTLHLTLLVAGGSDSKTETRIGRRTVKVETDSLKQTRGPLAKLVQDRSRRKGFVDVQSTTRGNRQIILRSNLLLSYSTPRFVGIQTTKYMFPLVARLEPVNGLMVKVLASHLICPGFVL